MNFAGIVPIYYWRVIMDEQEKSLESFFRRDPNREKLPPPIYVRIPKNRAPENLRPQTTAHSTPAKENPPAK